jgi:spore coat polysaccharide biosynthesis protein SpsF
MTQLIIVQARMSSRRLPGKVMREAMGKPLLAYLIERIARARRASGWLVATSKERDDDPIAAWCQRAKVEIYRGPLDNVAARFLGAARARQVRSFVRVSGDSPLLDPEILDRTIALFEGSDCDLATNVFPRSFPKGQSVEVVGTDALEQVVADSLDPDDLEHVTSFFYRHPDRFKIRNLPNSRDVSSVQLSVDSPEDFEAFQAVLTRMDRPHWTYGLDELLALRESIALR